VSIESDEYFRGAYIETIEENGRLKQGIEGIYSEVLRNLSAHLMPGRLLDIGCAMGHFMEYARRHSWNVHGVECSPYAASYGRNRWGLPIQAVCDLGEARLPESHFDACSMVEVVEHLPNPRQTLAQAFGLLKPGGMIYVTTPNFGSFRSLLQKQEWAAVIPTGHLYYFTFQTLGNLFHSVGFRQIFNLTPPADFDIDAGELRKHAALDLSNSELEEIRREALSADAGTPFNGRGEGLVMCALKPLASHNSVAASIRSWDPLPDLEGRLVRISGDGAEAEKVYLIHEGRKHWVTSVDWLRRHGRKLEETVQVKHDILGRFLQSWPLQ